MDAASLRRIIAGIGLIDASELEDDTSLLDQGALDSTGLVELQLALEEYLGREIEPDELDEGSLLTVNGTLAWLDRVVPVAAEEA